MTLLPKTSNHGTNRKHARFERNPQYTTRSTMRMRQWKAHSRNTKLQRRHPRTKTPRLNTGNTRIDTRPKHISQGENGTHTAS